MSSINIQPTIDLFRLLEGKPSEKELWTAFGSVFLKESFHQFQLNGEEYDCLERISRGDFSTTGLPQNASRFVRHIKNMLDNSDRILEELTELSDNFGTVDGDAKAKAREYCPRIANCSLAEVIFMPVPYDARVKNGKIFFDPLLAADLGKNGFTGFLAHEYHHSGRMSLRRVIDLEQSCGCPELIYSVYEILELEGIADMVFEISQLYGIIPQLGRLRRFRQDVFEGFEGYLRSIQEVLLQAIDNKLNNRGLRTEIADILFMKGENHPVGHRMAYEIEAVFGTAGLLECVGSPSAFLKTYQKAARLRGLFTFNERIVKFVSSYDTLN